MYRPPQLRPVELVAGMIDMKGYLLLHTLELLTRHRNIRHRDNAASWDVDDAGKAYFLQRRGGAKIEDDLVASLPCLSVGVVGDSVCQLLG